MEISRQRRRLPSLVRLLVLLQSAAVFAAFTNDFDAYPANTQPCLYSAAEGSSCDGSNVTAMNECLCGNGGGFVTNAASCIGRSDSTDLETVYTVMADACDFSKTPLSVSQREFMAAGAGSLSSSSSSSSSSSAATSTSSTASTSASASTSTSTSTSSSAVATTMTSVSGGVTVTITSTGATASNTGGSDSGGGGEGMSSTAKIGIVAGAAVAGIAIIAALIFFIIWTRRKKQPGEENRPMLAGPASIGPSGTELSYYAGAAGSMYDFKSHDGIYGDAKWPHPRSDSYPTAPSPVFYVGQAQPPHQPLQLQTQLQTQQQTQQQPQLQPQPGAVYELPSREAQQEIVEMPSTPVEPPAEEAFKYPVDAQTQEPHQHWGSTDYR